MWFIVWFTVLFMDVSYEDICFDYVRNENVLMHPAFTECSGEYNEEDTMLIYHKYCGPPLIELISDEYGIPDSLLYNNMLNPKNNEIERINLHVEKGANFKIDASEWTYIRDKNDYDIILDSVSAENLKGKDIKVRISIPFEFEEYYMQEFYFKRGSYCPTIGVLVVLNKKSETVLNTWVYKYES